MPPYTYADADVDLLEPNVSPADRTPPLPLRHRALHRLSDARLLAALVSEIPLATVAARFGVEHGKLQALQDQAARLAGIISTFSMRMGWPDYSAIFTQVGGGYD